MLLSTIKGINWYSLVKKKKQKKTFFEVDVRAIYLMMLWLFVLILVLEKFYSVLLV